MTSNIIVSGLTVTPKPWSVLLEWIIADPNVAASSTLQFSSVEVTVATVNDRSQGITFTGQTRTNALHVGIVDGQSYWYWIRAFDNSGTPGEYYPVSATNGVGIPPGFAATRSTLVNGIIVASLNAGALTIAVKYPDGSDPSTLKPVSVPVFDVTGKIITISIAAPLSITVPVSATLAFVTTAASRIGLSVLYKNGVIQLGVFNALQETAIGGFFGGTSAFSSFGLSDNIQPSGLSAPAISSSSNSAGIVYTTTLMSGPFSIRQIALLNWVAVACSAPGTWDVVPDVIELCTPDTFLPGSEVNSVSWRSNAFVNFNFVSATPADNTIPQFGEYKTVATLQVIPRSASNWMEMRATLQLAASVTTGYIGIGWAPSGGTGQIYGMKCVKTPAVADSPVDITISHTMRMLGPTPQNWTLVVMLTVVGHVYLNGISSGQLFGGVEESTAIIIERAG